MAYTLVAIPDTLPYRVRLLAGLAVETATVEARRQVRLDEGDARRPRKWNGLEAVRVSVGWVNLID